MVPNVGKISAELRTQPIHVGVVMRGGDTRGGDTIGDSGPILNA